MGKASRTKVEVNRREKIAAQRAAERRSERRRRILIASGSEVNLIVEAQKKLEERGVHVRVVSMPSWELFEAQPKAYRDEVLPRGVSARLAVEAGAPQGWCRYVGDRGDVLGLDHFGASAPGEVALREFGFTVENVCKHVEALL